MRYPTSPSGQTGCLGVPPGSHRGYILYNYYQCGRNSDIPCQQGHNRGKTPTGVEYISIGIHGERWEGGYTQAQSNTTNKVIHT